MKLTKDKIILTEKAKEIFDDVVESAFINKPSYVSSHSFEEVYNVMKKNEKMQKSELTPDDWFPIIVKLTNGKSFELWSSDRGGGVSSVLEDQNSDIKK
ncbi:MULTISPECIES: hypothetical protein [Bacillus subtilis group]|uniref:hypothetical protein n=1 Tax=Bacillus subtilis group TaxID=653685 RepID=UPI0006807AAF|nr:MULTISPECIES: hypothetical protein [Bacillus subtilis group]KND06264.1 hypothetical protein ACJ43_17450 [Bacillus paralicheniformis]MDE1403326.1 hypothetical protein [Bacillus licheniformis]MDQ9095487.1 hypothetical protein [Bacillus licheniformis]MEC0476939.1 hypothetical protein [Bacillus licheniformis]MEC0491096.1 hypothetical protein [Bacillus licheniformis]